MNGRFSKKNTKPQAAQIDPPPWVPPSPNKCHTWGSGDPTVDGMGIKFFDPLSLLYKTRCFARNIFLGKWSIQFDEHIFQMGWFNHQLVYYLYDSLCMVWYVMIWYAMIVPGKRNVGPLKINGWFRCNSYRHRPFFWGHSLVFGCKGASESHWFPSRRPDTKPLFLRGGYVRGGWLISHNPKAKHGASELEHHLGFINP